jgi:transposase
MRYELTDSEWAAIEPMLRNKPRGVPRVNDLHRSQQQTVHGPVARWSYQQDSRAGR